MGGASSNAAVFLQFLYEKCGVFRSVEDMTQEALQFGADIPFFLSSGTAWVEGIGEIIDPLVSITPYHYVIIYPNIECKTPVVYATLDQLGRFSKALSKNQVTETPIGKNDLLEPALHAYPELKACYEKIQETSQEQVYMTGSGSTFFIPFSSAQKAKDNETKLKNTYPKFIVSGVEPVSTLFYTRLV